MSPVGLILVCATALLTATANVMLTKGIAAAGGFNFDGLVSGLVRLFLTPLFVVGFLTYFIASVVWFRVLASEPVGIAYPLVVSLTFVLVALASVIVLGEPASPLKAAGMAIILLGIILVSTP